MKKHECPLEPEIAKKLAEHNTKIEHALCFGENPVTAELIIRTGKIDSKKRVGPMVLMCTYCPFCGAELRKKD